MLTMQYAKAMPDVRFNAADPGYTATDFNGHSGTQTVTEGTDADRHPGHRTAYSGGFAVVASGVGGRPCGATRRRGNR